MQEEINSRLISGNNVTPGGFKGRYQRFGGTYCLHLQAQP
jgi:hypothetical protein